MGKNQHVVPTDGDWGVRGRQQSSDEYSRYAVGSNRCRARDCNQSAIRSCDSSSRRANSRQGQLRKRSVPGERSQALILSGWGSICLHEATSLALLFSEAHICCGVL